MKKSVALKSTAMLLLIAFVCLFAAPFQQQAEAQQGNVDWMECLRAGAACLYAAAAASEACAEALLDPGNQELWDICVSLFTTAVETCRKALDVCGF